jgi:quinol monooxygenase YgiN
MIPHKPEPMVRYIISFTVAETRLHAVQKIIEKYFQALETEGPSGMRSQCYAASEDECSFIHIKSFRKEPAAKKHFNSACFRQYIEELKKICERQLTFSRLQQVETFESIY